MEKYSAAMYYLDMLRWVHPPTADGIIHHLAHTESIHHQPEGRDLHFLPQQVLEAFGQHPN